MARLSGANLAVFWADSQGTLAIPTIRTITPNINREYADYSANEDDVRNVTLTRIVAEPQLTYIDFDGIESGVAGTALRQRLRVGANGTLIWAEQGTATGKPKGALVCTITFNDAALVHDSETERNVFFMPRQGSFIADPGTAVW